MGVFINPFFVEQGAKTVERCIKETESRVKARWHSAWEMLGKKYENRYTEDMKSVQIKNSHTASPLDWLLYSYYLNNMSEYKDYFVGSTLGMAFEWGVHNIGYYGFNAIATALESKGKDGSQFRGFAERCMNVDLGPTIFHDSQQGSAAKLSFIMKLSYILLFNNTDIPSDDYEAYTNSIS